jgi:non-specific protein-tyrosine kinase
MLLDPALRPAGTRARLLACAVLALATGLAALVLVLGFRQPSGALAAVCGLAAGLVAASALAFAHDLVRRLPSAAAVAEELGLPLLAALPAPPAELRADELVTLAIPSHPAAERHARLAADVAEALSRHGARSVLVSGPYAGQGKSTTAANLAVALARQGRRVVLVDLDGWRPSTHRFFALFRTPGLDEVLDGAATLDECLVPIDLGLGTRSRGQHDALTVLPAGAGGRTLEPGRLASVRRLVARLEERSDIVILDAPPALALEAAGALGGLAPAALLVTGADASPSALARNAEQLEPAALVGCVVTAASAGRGRHDDAYYRWSAAVEAPREREPVAA